MSWGQGLLCCCLASSLSKTSHWFLIVGLISKSLKYSYKQPLISFMSPLSASILPGPLPPPYQSSRPGGPSFFPRTLSMPFYSELSHMCLLPGYPLLTLFLHSYPFSPANIHSSFRPAKIAHLHLSRALWGPPTNLFPPSQRKILHHTERS